MINLYCRHCGHCCGPYYKNRIANFNYENSHCNHVNLGLFQCKQCFNFSIAEREDEEKWGYDDYFCTFPLKSIAEAESIFYIFNSCTRTEWCKCAVHQAVVDWLDVYGSEISIFDRTDLIEEVKSNPLYPEWQQAWQRLILPRSSS